VKNFVFEIFERLSQSIPEPKLELDYTNPYTLLVAVVLSAQSTDKGVNKATKSLFKIVSTPQDMIDLGLEGLISFVKTIGLYQNKSKYIIELSKILVEKFNGNVPGNREDLEALPGVGRKTANVMLHEIFGQDTLAVDTHVFRVSHRLGLSNAKTPLGVEKDLELKIPKEFKNKAPHYLVLHGRYTCKAQKPLCATCCLKDVCVFYMSQKVTSK
jgi:endonuclease-3